MQDLALRLAGMSDERRRYLLGGLVRHLLDQGRSEQLNALLGRIEFVEAACRAGLLPDLIGGYLDTLQSGLPGLRLDQHEEFLRFLRRHGDVLSRSPGLTRQQAANEPGRSAVCRAAASLREVAVENRPWLRWINKPDVASRALWVRALENSVSACRYSPDGEILLAASWDGMIHVWDARSGVELGRWKCPVRTIEAADISPDGSRFILAGSGGGLAIGRLDDPGGIRRLPAPGTRLNACAFLPDGNRLIAAADDRTLRMWDAASGRELMCLEHTHDVFACAVSADGAFLLSGTGDGCLRLWAAEDGELLAEIGGHPGLPDRRALDGVCCCRFSPDGRHIAAGCWDGRLRIWDIASRKAVRLLEGHDGAVMDCAFSPCGNRIVTADWKEEGAGTLRIWDLHTGSKLLTLAGHTDGLRTCAWSPDGAQLVSGSLDDTMRTWDLRDLQAQGTEEATECGVLECSLSPDGAHFATLTEREELVLYETHRCGDATLPRPSVSARECAFAPDGRTLATLDGQGQVAMHSVPSLEPSRPGPLVDEPVRHLGFLPDREGLLMLTAGGRLLRWCPLAETLELLRCDLGATDRFHLSPDGSRLALTAVGSTRIRTAVFAGTGLHAIADDAEPGHPLAFSPDGSRIVYLDRDWHLVVRDASTGELLGRQGPLGGNGDFHASHASDRVLLASRDFAAELRRLSDGRLLHRMLNHRDEVSACALSPKGALAAVASRDRMLTIFDTITGEILTEFHPDAIVFDLVWSPDDRTLLARDATYQVLVFRLEDLHRTG